MAGATDEFEKIGIWKKLHPRKHETWIKNITNFIKNGGGYSGHCGGRILYASCIISQKHSWRE